MDKIGDKGLDYGIRIGTFFGKKQLIGQKKQVEKAGTAIVEHVGDSTS